MGLYNFKAQFVNAVLAGEKTHTIRSRRDFPDKPGSVLHLYTGLRQRGARLLMHVRCSQVQEIKIRADHDDKAEDFTRYNIWIDGQPLDADEKEVLAKRDGFENLQHMMLFWTKPRNRLPFIGDIIHWDYSTRDTKPTERKCHSSISHPATARK